jgi:hypothetical protein
MKDFKALLLNPFPQRVSPYAEQLREKSDQWIAEDYSRLPSSFCEMLKKINPAYWACCCWPDAPLSLLDPMTRAILWGVAYDDYYTSLSAEKLANVIDRTMEIARGASPTPDENPIHHQFSIFMRQFEQQATADWMKRYVYDMSQYFEGLKIDSAISYRKEVKYPSIKDYFPIRRMAMAAATVCTKVELATGILPDFIIVHPFIQKAKIWASDLMAWSNDMMSVEKEKGDDEALNLVLVIKNERKCSIEAAFSEAIQMYNTRLEEYVLLCNDAPDFGVYMPGVRAFLDGLDLWISGQINWFNYTKRYKIADVLSV